MPGSICSIGALNSMLWYKRLGNKNQHHMANSVTQWSSHVQSAEVGASEGDFLVFIRAGRCDHTRCGLEWDVSQWPGGKFMGGCYQRTHLEHGTCESSIIVMFVFESPRIALWAWGRSMWTLLNVGLVLAKRIAHLSTWWHEDGFSRVDVLDWFARLQYAGDGRHWLVDAFRKANREHMAIMLCRMLIIQVPKQTAQRKQLSIIGIDVLGI